MNYTTPLLQEHLRAGAKLTDFAGWMMPLVYPQGTLAEHNAVRSSVGLFDVTHLGKIVVTGLGAPAALDVLLPGKIAKLAAGRAAYNLVLTEGGTVVDDIFVYRMPEGFLIVPNASNMDAVLDIVRAGCGPGVAVEDARERWAIIALTGPRARQVLLPELPGVEELKMHNFAHLQLGEFDVMVARTGYTGELTYELFAEWEQAPAVWSLLLELGAAAAIAPAGLGARDTLRLEMGYPLHGHELSVQINPLEAGLGWVIDWDKQFIGKDALVQVKRQGVARKLVGLRGTEGRIPRMGHPVLLDGLVVGSVTSGNFSPTLGVPIALAFVSPEAAQPGCALTIDVRGKQLPVTVVKPPFIRT
ncbi:MAG: glycine cleavage system aminomethyltransferase GcvT [Actinomycetota bacterium]